MRGRPPPVRAPGLAPASPAPARAGGLAPIITHAAAGPAEQLPPVHAGFARAGRRRRRPQILAAVSSPAPAAGPSCGPKTPARRRSEEHTSELQSRENLVCRLL